MKAINLSMENKEEALTFEFGGTTRYAEGQASVIARGIAAALYGDESLNCGKVEFSFEQSGDTYSITRDFFNNTALLTKNGQDFSKGLADVGQSVTGLSRNACQNIILPEITNAFEQFNGDAGKFIADILSAMEIDESTLRVTSEESALKSAKLKAVEEYLVELSVQNSEDSGKLDSDNQKLAGELTAAEEKAEHARIEYEKADKLVLEAAALSEQEIMSGVGQKDSEFDQKLMSFYKENEQKRTELSAEKEKLEKALNEICEQVETQSDSLKNVIISPQKAAALRLAIAEESELRQISEQLEKLEAEKVSFTERIGGLNIQLTENKHALSEAKAILKGKIGKEGAEAGIYSEYNESEREKQTLYRNQILAAATQREIEAIDNKIYENEGAKRTYDEDLEALRKAKSTLLGYIEKLDDKLASVAEKLTAVSGQKRYFESVDTVEYGGKCPVCKGKVMDKTDMRAENAAADKAYAALNEERQKALGVKKDYDAQLDKVNIRLGELSARVKASEAYITSLKDTKEAKIGLIKKVLDESRARSLGDLTALLDASIKKAAIIFNKLSAYNSYSALEKSIGYNIDLTVAAIRRLESGLQEIEEITKQLTQKAEALSRQLELKDEVLGQADAISREKELADGDSKAEALTAEIKKLLLSKETAQKRIFEIKLELISLESGDAVTAEGVKTRDSIIALLISERFEKNLENIQSLFNAKEKAYAAFMGALIEVKELRDKSGKLKEELHAALLVKVFVDTINAKLAEIRVELAQNEETACASSALISKDINYFTAQASEILGGFTKNRYGIKFGEDGLKVTGKTVEEVPQEIYTLAGLSFYIAVYSCAGKAARITPFAVAEVPQAEGIDPAQLNKVGELKNTLVICF